MRPKMCLYKILLRYYLKKTKKKKIVNNLDIQQ